ncbi:MAG: hypothetical protein K2X28_06905 [Alphaproteobacteria bacterium]|nr:hypothetical protein [Alphaproteobacteria bacterium]
MTLFLTNEIILLGAYEDQINILNPKRQYTGASRTIKDLKCSLDQKWQEASKAINPKNTNAEESHINSASSFPSLEKNEEYY